MNDVILYHFDLQKPPGKYHEQDQGKKEPKLLDGFFKNEYPCHEPAQYQHHKKPPGIIQNIEDQESER